MSKSNELKRIEMKNCLYQRFYIIGIDNDLILSDTLYNDPFAINISPKIITKFPPLHYSYCTIPDQLVIHHCFPEGYSFIKGPPLKPNEIFSFSLDNFPMNILDNEEYETVYFTCNLFYESLQNCYRLKEKYKNYNNENNNNNKVDELTEGPYSKIYVPKVICFASLLPFYIETSKLLMKIHNYYSSPRTLIAFPIEKQIENIIFSIPIPPRGQFVIDYKLHKVSFPITPINQIPNPSNDLQQLFRIFQLNEEILKIIKCLLLEVPMIFFCLNKEKLTNIIESLLSLLYPFKYKNPHIAILPTNCFSIIENSDCFVLGINESYKENFFIDNNINLETKRILIIDMDSKIKKVFMRPEKVNRTLLFLGEKEEKEDGISEPPLENIELPSHAMKKFTSNISKYFKTMKNPKSQKESEFNMTIREEFYQLMISLILDYGKYLRLEKVELEKFDTVYISRHLENLNINDIFIVEGFLKDNAKSFHFYNRFIKTRIFLYFMVKKLYPKSLKDKLNILLLDEKIIERKNKNFFSFSTETPFIKFKDFLNENFRMEIMRNNNFTPNEGVCISSNLKKCLTYFQDISITSNENTEKNKKGKTFILTYPIFPKFLYDDKFFLKEYEQLCLSSNFTMPDNQLMKKCQMFIEDPKYTLIYKDSQYRLNLYDKSTIHNLPMKDYIILDWLFLCAGTLWYCDEDERDYNVQNIFDILEKISYIEEDVIVYIFLSLVKWGKDYQVIKMYELMESYDAFKQNYTLFALLCMKMTKNFNNFKKRGKKEFKHATLITRESESNITLGENKMEFRKRSLLKQKDDDDGEIKFENVIICPNCKNEYEIDFEKILDESHKQYYDFLTCPNSNCNTKVKAQKIQIRVMIGDDESQLTQFYLINPYLILEKLRKDFIKNEDYIVNIKTMRKRSPDLYFSTILAFAICDLPHDFMIPYEGDKENEEELVVIKRKDFYQLKIQSGVNNCNLSGIENTSNGI